MESGAFMDLAIVIVNYNVVELLRRCLQTVLASEGDFTYRVVVVDNHSTDASVAMLRREFPAIPLIMNSDNRGYAEANNQGLRLVGVESENPPRYCLLLNPDTELLPRTLADALAYMDAHPQVGVMGPKLLLPNGTLDVACRRSFPTPAVSFYRMLGLSQLFPHSRRFGRYNLTYLDMNTLHAVDSVVGAFMWLRTEAIQQAGLLDEQFWMYGEDLDWAKRIKDHGWEIMYNPQVVAYHVKRASSRQNRRAALEFYRAMLIFYYKHYRAQTAWPLHLLVLLGISLKGGPAVWRDVRLGPAILR